MRTFFVLACLVAAAAAAPQLLADSYLPPDPRPTYPQKTSTCLPAPDVYKTTYVTYPVNKVEQRYTEVYAPQTQYITRTQIVPKTVVRTVVKTEIVPVSEVKVVYSTVYRTDYKTVTKRGPDQVIQKTVIRTVPIVQTKYVSVTKAVTETVPKVVLQTVKSTQIVYSTVQVPEYKTETKVVSRQLPDTTRTVVKYLTNTVYRTETLPAKTVVQRVTETKVVAVTKTVQQPAKTVVVNKTVVKTVTQPVVKTEYYPQVVTETKVNYVPRTEVRYVSREVVVPVTKVVPYVVTDTDYKTEYRQRAVTNTQYRTAVVSRVVTLPGKVVTKTGVKYVDQTKVVPGIVKTIVKPVTNVRTINKVVTVNRDKVSTVYRTSVVKETCGYNYDAPRNPLKF